MNLTGEQLDRFKIVLMIGLIITMIGMTIAIIYYGGLIKTDPCSLCQTCNQSFSIDIRR